MTTATSAAPPPAGVRRLNDCTLKVNVRAEPAGSVLATEAVTGAEGRGLVDEVQPVLITLDLNLPDMDGIDLCSQLRAVTDAHILTISARPPHLTQEQCLLAGSDHFMPKPFSPRELGAYLDGVFPREGAA